MTTAGCGTRCGPMARLRSVDAGTPGGRGSGAPVRSPRSDGARWYAGAVRALTVLSAVLIAVGGYVHFCLYRHGYRFVPEIGMGFLLQFTSSAVVAVALLLVRGSVRLGRRRLALRQLVRLVGIALAVGTLAALAIAHTSGGLFGFRERGLEPAPQTLITILVEYEAAVLLAIAMFGAHFADRRTSASGRIPRTTRLPDAA